MAGKALAALATVVLTVLLVAGAAAFFVSRDDATVPRASEESGPGDARPAGAQPAVRPGNVTLLHSDERLTLELRRLAERIGGPPDPALREAGQAVLVQQRPNLDVPVTAITATRMLEANGPDDPGLETFIEYWLGRR